MVEKNSHNVDAAASNAAGGDAATQKLSPLGVPKEATASVAKATAGKAAGISSPPAASSDSGAGNSVAARRAAHGLSPEATSSTDSVEATRTDKEASTEDRKLKAQRQHKAKVIRRTVIAIVLVILVGIIVGFWLLRWGLHDDISSIQGKWRVQGTDTVIEINDEEIILTDEVAYDYALDPEAKTLAFKFGALTGNGRYRFSLDHNMLAIDDGEFDAMGTLATDIPWTLEALSQKLLANQEKNPRLEDGDMVLERIS